MILPKLPPNLEMDTGDPNRYGDNPKNFLAQSGRWQPGKAPPIAITGYGPEHDLVLVAELAVPLADGATQLVRARGRTKPLAERACAAAACDLLKRHNLLERDKLGLTSPRTEQALVTSTKEERSKREERGGAAAGGAAAPQWGGGVGSGRADAGGGAGAAASGQK